MKNLFCACYLAICGLAHAQVLHLDLTPLADIDGVIRGGEVGTGIVYDLSSRYLLVDQIKFGSNYGFEDLEGAATGVYLWRAGENPTDGFDLRDITSVDLLTQAGNISAAGIVEGVVGPWNAERERDLLDGFYYVSIFSQSSLDGPVSEVRGQISPIPEAHEYALLAGLGLLGFAAVRRFRSSVGSAS
jgi:hypothetical protein